MEYTVKAHPYASALIRSADLSEALAMARTTAQFMGRCAYVYSPFTGRHFTVAPPLG